MFKTKFITHNNWLIDANALSMVFYNEIPNGAKLIFSFKGSPASTELAFLDKDVLGNREEAQMVYEEICYILKGREI